jgi:hypothetical protein
VVKDNNSSTNSDEENLKLPFGSVLNCIKSYKVLEKRLLERTAFKKLQNKFSQMSRF